MLDDALTTLQAGFRRDPHPTAAVRRDWLERLRHGLLARADEVVQAIDQDFKGRSAHESRMAEIFMVVDGIRHARSHVARWMKPRGRRLSWLFQPATGEVRPQPLGVVGVMAPWNYPVQLALLPMATALAAGNRVLLKPSEVTPATSAVIAALVSEALPADVAQVVQGGPEVGAEFAALPLDHLFFTGSTTVGRKVMQAAAKNLTPVTLELGGKSPVIVAPGYDLEHAAERIVQGKLFNAGQTCIAPDYALVARGEVSAFVEALHRAARTLYPTYRTNPDYTSIVNDRHHERLQGLIEDAMERGATVSPLGSPESFEGSQKMQPSLVQGGEGARIYDEEIFGPLLPVIAMDSFSGAIDYVRDRPHPLALYLFDRDPSRVEQALQLTRSGGVTLNDTLLHVAQEELPFGGVGPSGMGCYHGKAGFDQLSHLRSVMRQSRVGSSSLLNPPYGRLVETMVRVLTRRP